VNTKKLHSKKQLTLEITVRLGQIETIYIQTNSLGRLCTVQSAENPEIIKTDTLGHINEKESLDLEIKILMISMLWVAFRDHIHLLVQSANFDLTIRLTLFVL